MLDNTIKQKVVVKLENDIRSPLIFEIPVFQEVDQKYWEKEADILISIFQKIAEVTINQAYQLAPEIYLDTKIDNKPFRIYKQNHDVTHAARQVSYKNVLLDLIQEHTQEKRFKQAITDLTPEEQGILSLATYCLRIGRLNEDGEKAGSQHTRYSAELFADIAMQLGHDRSLIDNVKQAMYSKKPKFIENSRYHGFVGNTNEEKLDKSKLFREIFHLAHQADLVRCWDARGDAKFNNIYEPMLKQLNYLLGNATQMQQDAVDLIDYAARSCVATGNKVHIKSDEHHILFDYDYHKKKKGRCVKDVHFCFESLSKVKRNHK